MVRGDRQSWWGAWQRVPEAVCHIVVEAEKDKPWLGSPFLFQSEPLPTPHPQPVLSYTPLVTSVLHYGLALLQCDSITADCAFNTLFPNTVTL